MGPVSPLSTPPEAFRSRPRRRRAPTEGAVMSSLPLSSTARLARLSARHPWRTVLIWVLVLVAAGAVQAISPMRSTTDVTLLNDPESNRGWDLLQEHGIREQRPGTETVIVRTEATTVDDPAF